MTSESPTTDDDGPGGSDSELTLGHAGPRYSGNPELLRIERELVADGVDLPNRAVPVEWHPRESHTTEELRARIEAETETEHPNRALIGVLNAQL